MRPGAQDQAAFSTPGAAVQASASLPSPGILQRWVCTSISANCSGTLAAAALFTLNLRNDATGAGTIIWSKTFEAPAGSFNWEVNLSDLTIPGVYNKAMTLEFAAAGGAGSVESVAFTAYQSS